MRTIEELVKAGLKKGNKIRFVDQASGEKMIGWVTSVTPPDLDIRPLVNVVVLEPEAAKDKNLLLLWDEKAEIVKK